jgi:hypothetical protein
MAKDGDRLPDLMCNIYDAFDAGEYQHREDPPDTDPEIKYTRPLLTKVLTRCGAT